MRSEVRARTLEEYQTSGGEIPFKKWLESLDMGEKAKVRARLERLRQGNYGDSKSLKGCPGIFELRIDHGSGYRVYFANSGDSLVILLIGGAKKSQKRDIDLAVKYWKDYQERV